MPIASLSQKQTPFSQVPVREAWLARQTEAVLDPDLPIIDPHHPLWDWAPDQRYLFDELMADITTGHNVRSTVYVDCAAMLRSQGDPNLRFVGETEFVNGIAAMSASGNYGDARLCAAIVGHADLRLGARVDYVLEAHIQAGGGRFRGIRNSSGYDPDNPRGRPAELLADAEFRVGFARLAQYGLSFDAWMYHHQLHQLADLARAFPDTSIILDHLGTPHGTGRYAGRRREEFDHWRDGMRLLAGCANIVVKLGGLGMGACGFDFHLQPTPPSSVDLAEHWRPYIETAIELFGSERCMFESNFPADKGSCTYVALWNAFKRITASATADEKRGLFFSTAARVWIDADPSNAIEVNNPATGDIIGLVPKLGAKETREAIEAAAAAQKEWAARTAKERSVILRRWFDLMIANKDDLKNILTLEQGKPLAEATGEIVYGVSFVEWFAEEARRVYVDLIPGHQIDKRLMVMKQPIGVVAAITPWNFPNAMITRKAAPAFAAGCAMVLKPASQTPFSAIALAVLAERAGLPKGLFSIITGSAVAIGGEMTANPTVRKLTFTGSTEIGAELYKQSAPTIKKLGLELGGNAPFIVFDDADLDAAVEGAMIAKYRNNGQTCVCANRIYVQEAVYDAFADKLSRAVKQLKTGDGFEQGTVLGPLIDKAALEKVEEHITDATSKGARVVLGGRRHALGGNFFEPTILADVTAAMAVAREETFGPVAPLFRFKDENDVIAQANDTEFGLASYFYAKDMSRVFRVAEALEYGMVGVNTGLISTAEAPFGGVKLSGLGREGSRYGIEEFLEVKYVCIGGIG